MDVGEEGWFVDYQGALVEACELRNDGDQKVILVPPSESRYLFLTIVGRVDSEHGGLGWAPSHVLCALLRPDTKSTPETPFLPSCLMPSTRT